MTKIPIADAFLPAIREGKKVGTVRARRRDYDLGKAMMVGETTGEIEFIKIKQITYKRFEDLTHVDAVRDGFADVDELRSVLMNFYPGIQDYDVVTVVLFERIEE